MKKTLTAALAMSAIAGLAMADVAPIETAPAGRVNVTGTGSSQFVANPFVSFSESEPMPTLAQFDGASLSPRSYITLISSNGKKMFDAIYTNDCWTVVNNIGETNESLGVETNNCPLPRGAAIQFNGRSGETITVCGILDRNGGTSTLVKGHNFVGNYSPYATTLDKVSIVGFTLNKDYLKIGATKYAYLPAGKASVIGVSAGWYLYDAIKNIGDGSVKPVPQGDKVTIPAGAGIHVYRYAGGTGTITMPGMDD